MKRTALQSLGHSLVVAAAALLIGCAGDAPIGPPRAPAAAQLAAPIEPAPAVAGVAAALSANAGRAPQLGACDSLRVPARSRLAFRVYAQGVQIYRWNGASWSFVGPAAVLSADAEGKSTVGIHYAGPTWESMSGGKLVGTVLKRCIPDANAISWLLLGAVSDGGPGVFHRVTFIQRVNTAGGNAPSGPGSVIGEEARIPYTTEYFFYRSR